VTTDPPPHRTWRPEAPEETDRRIRTSLIGGIAALVLTLAGAVVLLELARTQKSQVCLEQGRKTCASVFGELPAGRTKPQ
jgi:hypothetical protein